VVLPAESKPHAAQAQQQVQSSRVLALPESCLVNIMRCIAANLEPGGVYGPSLVAKDLASAALVSACMGVRLYVLVVCERHGFG